MRTTASRAEETPSDQIQQSLIIFPVVATCHGIFLEKESTEWQCHRFRHLARLTEYQTPGNMHSRVPAEC